MSFGITFVRRGQDVHCPRRTPLLPQAPSIRRLVDLIYLSESF